jgi:thymidylate kinase
MAAMDEGAARALMAIVARELNAEVILWRGGEFAGSDVDVLVLPGAEARLTAILAREGLRPALSDPGHVMWSYPDGPEVHIDVLTAARWPAYHPSLDGLRERTVEAEGLPPVASPSDQLLIVAAEAVAGRPLAKVLRRARRLVEGADGSASLDEVARAEGLEPLAALVADPGRLERRGRKGRLPYPAAIATALRSRAARLALRSRVAGRLARDRPRRQKGVLVTISGMDGAGKSTFTEAITMHLRAAGHPARDEIVRIGRHTATLDRIAGPVKRILRREGPIADHLAAGDAGEGAEDLAPDLEPRRGVAWAWATVVAIQNALYCRRVARGRRRESIVADRWLADHLIDFEFRYGRHRLADRILRAAVPRPDLAFLLQIDAATSAARKPGDQVPLVLARMEERYPVLAAEFGLIAVDGTAPRDEVEAVVLALVDSLVAAR